MSYSILSCYIMGQMEYQVWYIIGGGGWHRRQQQQGDTNGTKEGGVILQCLVKPTFCQLGRSNC